MPSPKLGLALGGGGARGLAHIGVLKVLEDAGIPIDIICGTSMGGLVAAAFSAGHDARGMEAHAIELTSLRRLMKLVDLSPRRRGLIEGERVQALIEDLIPALMSFEELRIPTAVTAVDLISSREIVLSEGPLLPAVMATIAIPGLFHPVEASPYRLVDGGVLNNLPVDLARRLGADIVLAVDVQVDPCLELPWQDQPEKPHFPLPMPNFLLDFYRAELIMIAEITRARLLNHPPDMLLRPCIPSDLDIFLGFPRAAECIAAGEAAMAGALPELAALLESPGIPAVYE